MSALNPVCFLDRAAAHHGDKVGVIDGARSLTVHGPGPDRVHLAPKTTTGKIQKLELKSRLAADTRTN
ncbi:hypothetical protein [Gordonia sp. OPL2]|uniref:hypothetical protein n=1 Tax=Gordonia sp. OPL2 TaxID=2486274 RepID=UPI0016552A5C|nr:hypothetical protein [Gordonia sp. OPL2]